MKKLYLLALTVIFTLTGLPTLTAQITAGSVPSGMYVYNPNVNLSVSTCGISDSTSFDINCDGIPDVAIKLYKGYTPIDGTNYALLYVLNDTIELCKDTVGNFSGLFGRPHYYNFGDTLSQTATSFWATDTIYQLGDYGAWLITGPSSVSNMYISYRKGSQIGWMKISFSLGDFSICSNPITLSITSVLTPCNSIGVEEIFSKDNIHLYPNPFCMQTVLLTDNPLNNANLTVVNCFGQSVKHIKNISGQTITLYRDNLPSGLYFIQLRQDNKVIMTKKIIIND